MSLYNMSELTQGSNIVEWMVIFNNMSNGIMFGGLSIAIVLVLFGVMKMQKIETDIALIGSGFTGFLVTGLMWTIEFNGMRLVPTIVPFMMMIIVATALFMRIIRDWI